MISLSNCSSFWRQSSNPVRLVARHIHTQRKLYLNRVCPWRSWKKTRSFLFIEHANFSIIRFMSQQLFFFSLIRVSHKLRPLRQTRKTIHHLFKHFSHTMGTRRKRVQQMAIIGNNRHPIYTVQPANINWIRN